MKGASTEPLVTLGDLCNEPVDHSGPKGQFVYVDISSIDRDTKRIVEPKMLPLEMAPSRAKQVLKAGDVLVSMTRPNLNAVALVPDHLDGAIGSTGFHVLRSKWLSPQFLLGLVQLRDFIDEMSVLVQGALYPAVRPKDISAYRFKFEVPAQQARIVTKLEELLCDLDAGVAELTAAQKKLQKYRQSLLKAAVEGALTADWREAQRQRGKPTETGAQLLARILTDRRARWEARQLANFKEHGKAPPKDWQKKYPEPVQPDTTDLPQLPEGWVWASVDQLCVVVRGASPRPAGDPRYFGGSIPWITVGSITRDDDVYLLETEGFVTEAGKDASRYIEAGTLLLTNSGATLGVPKISKIAGCINDGSVALLDVEEDTKLYLYWFLRTQTDRLRSLNQGAAQPNLNTAIVRRIVVPISPPDEQREIIGAIDVANAASRNQDMSVERALRQSISQRQNILRAAFAGQLVPQDPKDEPASALLERIYSERAERASKAKARKIKKHAEA